MYDDSGRVGREVVDLTDLDFAFLVSFENGLDDLGGGCAEGYLGDDKRFVIIGFLDTGTDFHYPTSFAVVVTGNIDDAPCREVRIELEVLITQVCQCCIAEFVEVMRQDLGIESDCNSLHSLCQ